MIEAAVLTVSDSAALDTRADLSGPALVQRCRELQWQIAAQEILPDDPARISQQLADWADTERANLILTTGGTGIGPRDRTPEATRAILECELPGFGELMRSKGMEQTPLAALSRSLAGTRRRSLIVNLPGSPRAALFSFAAIEHLIPHALQLLAGHTEH